VLLQTLLKVFRTRSGSFPEEVMQSIFTFAMGSLIDMVCRM
jgi:tripartite-type tricarboxylate transporter receptor subunit TctC